MVERFFALFLTLVAGLSIQTAGRDAGGELRVFVTQLDGAPSLELAADDPVYTASLIKLLVVEQLLERGEPAADVLELARRAIEGSDDAAMNQLWSEQDGPGLVTSGIAAFNLTGTSLPVQAGAWGETLTTARDVAAVLVNYRTRLTPADSSRLTGWLLRTERVAPDGFDQYFGVRAVGVVGVAAKQGWSCCVGGERVLHSAGVLPDGRVVVVLGTFPRSTSYDAAKEALNRAVQAALSTVQ